MPPLVQNTLMSDAHEGAVCPQAWIVTRAPDSSRPMIAALMSTGPPSFSRSAQTSVKSSPARSDTVFSM